MPALTVILAHHPCIKKRTFFYFSSLFFVGLLLVFSVASCDLRADKPPLDEDTYITVLSEMFLLRTMQNLSKDNEFAQDVKEQVLRYHDISLVSFEKSHDYYFGDKDRQHDILMEVRQRIEGLNLDLFDYEQDYRNESRTQNSEKNEE